jgi:hypothetical protein
MSEDERKKLDSSLVSRTSVWVDGLRFRLTEAAIVKMETEDNEKKRATRYVNAFATSIGEALYPSMLTRPRAVKGDDGKTVVERPKGTFVDLYNRVMTENRTKTSKEILTAVISSLAGKELQITRRDVIALGRSGNFYPGSIVDINIVNA